LFEGVIHARSRYSATLHDKSRYPSYGIGLLGVQLHAINQLCCARKDAEYVTLLRYRSTRREEPQDNRREEKRAA
jgi:hypothetical protein